MYMDVLQPGKEAELLMHIMRSLQCAVISEEDISVQGEEPVQLKGRSQRGD